MKLVWSRGLVVVLGSLVLMGMLSQALANGQEKINWKGLENTILASAKEATEASFLEIGQYFKDRVPSKSACALKANQLEMDVISIDEHFEGRGLQYTVRLFAGTPDGKQNFFVVVVVTNNDYGSQSRFELINKETDFVCIDMYSEAQPISEGDLN